MGEEMGIVGECRAWVFVMAAGVVWSTLRPWTEGLAGWLGGSGDDSCSAAIKDGAPAIA